MTTLIKGTFRTVSVLSLVSLVGLGGCGLFKKKSANDGDAAVTAPVVEAVDAAPPPPAPIAANVNDVSRFPDEKPLENVAATIQRTTNVREIPSVGKIVASLAKGGSVTQIAQRGTAFLVVFENTKDQKKLMGWVGQEAFGVVTAADAGASKTLSCTAPEVPLVSDGPFCGRICAGDGECPLGQACKGAANKLVKGRLGDAVTVCTVFTPGAVPGTAKPVAVTPPVAVAPPPATPTPTKDVTAAVGGACPAGFALVAKDGQCHKICTIGQCSAAARFCTPCQGVTVCAATLNFCK